MASLKKNIPRFRRFLNLPSPIRPMTTCIHAGFVYLALGLLVGCGGKPGTLKSGSDTATTTTAITPTPQPQTENTVKARIELPPITAADWPSYNYDDRGWRFNSAETSLTPSNASKLEEKWRFPAKDSKQQIGVIHATPTVVNGCVYFGTATYPAFYKLKPDGTLAWVYSPVSRRTSTSPIPPRRGTELY